MTTQAVVTLERLRCVRESDTSGSSHSEPYVWPALGVIRDYSFEITPQFALLSDSRSIVKNEMRAGDVAPIPYPGNTLKANFDDSLTRRELILFAALWEEDSSPASAVQAGYQAYLDELQVAVGSNLIALNNADEDGQKAIIEVIKQQVYAKVYAAEEGELSSWEKTKVYFGWLNLDDFMGVAYSRFETLAATTFSLTINGFAGDLVNSSNPPIEYEIEGSVTVETTENDPCQGSLDAVSDAESAIDGLQAMVLLLQKQLQQAPPPQKAAIVAEIRYLNEVRIPDALARLARARRALELCRILPPVGPTSRPPINP